MSTQDELRRAPGAVRYGTVDSSVIRDPSLSLNAKAVYSLLATYASGGGDRAAYPGRETMAEMLGCSPDTVDRALKQLRQAGVLVTHRRQRQTSLHFLHDMGAPRAVGKPVDNPADLDSAPVPTQGENGVPAATLSQHGRVLDSAPVPSKYYQPSNTSDNGPSDLAAAPVGAPPQPVYDGALPGLYDADTWAPGTPNPNTVEALDARGKAQHLAGEWWERFTPRPTAAFVGQRKIVQRLLEAGWEPEALRAVLATEQPPLVLARLEQRLRGGTTNGRASTIVPIADWENGATYYGG